MHRIGIIGGGFSGIMLAVQLLNSEALRPCSLHLIEASQIGGGVAYSTNVDAHILNIPAANMSAFPDDPLHFVRWAERKVEGGLPITFHRRAVYREYLQELLVQSERQNFSKCTLHRMGQRVTAIVPSGEGYRLLFARHVPIFFDQVVLAMGHYPPAPLPQLTSPSRNYVHDIWKDPWVEEIGKNDAVFILGTGLSMVDIVRQLQAMGHQGQIHALSRHGFVLQNRKSLLEVNCVAFADQMLNEAIADESPIFLPQSYQFFKELPREVSSILRMAREEIAEVAKVGVHENCVISGILQHVGQRIDEWPMEIQQRFLRHLGRRARSWLYGYPQESADVVERLRETQQLQCHKGMLDSVRPVGDTIVVQIRDQRELRVRWVFNCTGPAQRLQDIADPLIQQLHRDGLIRPDAWGNLLEASSGGAVRPGMWCVGPVKKDPYTRNNTVPQLRRAVKKLADTLSK